MITHIRFDQNMEQGIQEMIKNNYFQNKSEFIRDAVRKSLEEYQMQKVLEKIKELQGTGKGKTPKKLIEKDYENMLNNIRSGRTLQKLRKYNLKRA